MSKPENSALQLKRADTVVLVAKMETEAKQRLLRWGNKEKQQLSQLFSQSTD